MVKHKEVRRYKYLRPDDFFLYIIDCSCGKECGGWTPKEAEEIFEKHITKGGE